MGEVSGDTVSKERLAGLWSSDRAAQNEAFGRMMEETDQPVDWAYEVWEELLANLGHRDNHNRAIAAQVLCNLAKSDSEGRMLTDLPALVAVTRDKRFVTARHCLQSLWKIGAAGEEKRKVLVAALRNRFEECASEKNWSLIRYDIIVSLRRVYDATEDDSVESVALKLIDTETDTKYRKKYAGVWKK